MSETTLKIALAELNTLRIMCTQCSVIVEVSLDNMEQYGQKHPHCHNCGTAFMPPMSGANHFWQLAHAIKALTDEKGVRVEFVIPGDR